MRTIGAWSHGIIDYVIFIILVTGPSFAGFAGRQATLAYLLAALLFILTITTRFPLGVFKIVSFHFHGVIEFLFGILLLILPWIANFSRGVKSRNFYVFVALLILIVATMTDFRNRRAAVPSTRGIDDGRDRSGESGNGADQNR